MAIPEVKHRAFRFGVFEIDVESQELRKRGVKVRLGGQALQLLLLLLQRPGEVVTREELRQAMWPGEAWGDHDQRLNKAVNKIREALGDSADTPRFLETLPRLGYRFLFPAEGVGPTTAAPVPAVAVTPELPAAGVAVPMAEPAVEPAVAPKAGSRWAVWAGIGVAVVALMAAVLPTRREPAAGSQPLIPLPLTTFVGAEEGPSFAPDGAQVVFSWNGERRDNPDLYVAVTGVGGARRLTTDAAPDVNPAWSPDGRWIAFRRMKRGDVSELWLVRPDGSEARRLSESKRLGEPGRIAWARDSRAVIAADTNADGLECLYVISVDAGERRLLTSPPGQFRGDHDPALSPNGRMLAFTRDTATHWRDLFVLEVDAGLRPSGNLTRVTTFQSRIGTLAWTADNTEVLFSAATPAGGASHLYRVRAAGGPIRDVAGVRVEGYDPVIAPHGRQLLFSRRTSEPTTIHRIDLRARTPTVTALLSSTSRDYSPDVSPDGSLVVMSSGRSGTPQLWVFRPDGSAPRQITFQGKAGASVPRWSPDGKSVVFESRPDGQSDIFVADVASGTVRRLTRSPLAETRANFSRDGRFVYFGAAMPGQPYQLHRVSVSGGTPERLTRGTGLFGVEALDGRSVYYTSAGPVADIRQVPYSGGPETTIVSDVLGRSALAVGRQGLFFLSAPLASGATTVGFLAYGAKVPKLIATLQHPVHNAIALSPDESYLLYTEMGRPESDLLLLDNFR